MSGLEVKVESGRIRRIPDQGAGVEIVANSARTRTQPELRRDSPVCESARTVADAAINPAVRSPTQIAGDRVGVARALAGEQRFLLVSLAVAVGVANPVSVGRLRNDHAVFVEHE